MLGPFDLIAILLMLAAAFCFINHLWLRLPGNAALFLLGLAFSLAMMGLPHRTPWRSAAGCAT
ncbi:hypothetical protein [Azospirillum sp. sgz301742]